MGSRLAPTKTKTNKEQRMAEIVYADNYEELVANDAAGTVVAGKAVETKVVKAAAKPAADVKVDAPADAEVK